MIHPFRRSAVLYRPTLRPAPGMPAFELAPAVDIAKAHEDSDWALWDDTVPLFDTGARPVESFEQSSGAER